MYRVIQDAEIAVETIQPYNRDAGLANHSDNASRPLLGYHRCQLATHMLSNSHGCVRDY